jgi:hypothetical protein
MEEKEKENNKWPFLIPNLLRARQSEWFLVSY